MNTIPFLERLKQDKPLLGDGAMGTMLHGRGVVPLNTCFDELNLTQPDLVLTVHKDYIAAGADLIESNTFGANRYKLHEYGLADKVTDINRTGVELARRAVDESGRENVYVAGSVGPLGIRLKPYGRLDAEDARAAFREQISALVEGGVDLILLETFADHGEVLEALHAARQVAPDVPVVCQTTFTSDDYTLLGFTPARVAHELRIAGADVIGVNCSGGPAQLSQILQSMRNAVPDAFLSAMPNAGFPETVGGRVMYSATADYFGDYALTFREIGAHIIGGCCGTTPDHIAAMRAALDDPNRTDTHIHVQEVDDDTEGQDRAFRPTTMLQRVRDGQFVVTVEMAPPRSYNVDKLLKHARLLRDAGADFINVADTPAARMKMSAWAVCHLLQTHVGIETVLHFPTRGRNVLRVQGDLLAAHALDLRNLFVVMGDPTRIGDYPDANDQFDIPPSRLISLIKQQMNNGKDLAGKSIGSPTAFTVACALNMGAEDLDREIRVLMNKLEAGADFALGQAIFDPDIIDRFHERYQQIVGEPFTLPVLVSVIPLASVRHARYLHNEVPGIQIPDAIFERMDTSGNAGNEGVKIAQELLVQMGNRVQGAYIIPPREKYTVAAQVVNAVARGRHIHDMTINGMA